MKNCTLVLLKLLFVIAMLGLLSGCFDDNDNLVDSNKVYNKKETANDQSALSDPEYSSDSNSPPTEADTYFSYWKQEIPISTSQETPILTSRDASKRSYTPSALNDNSDFSIEIPIKRLNLEWQNLFSAPPTKEDPQKKGRLYTIIDLLNRIIKKSSSSSEDIPTIKLARHYDVDLPEGWGLEKNDDKTMVLAHGPIANILAANFMAFGARETSESSDLISFAIVIAEKRVMENTVSVEVWQVTVPFNMVKEIWQAKVKAEAESSASKI